VEKQHITDPMPDDNTAQKQRLNGGCTLINIENIQQHTPMMHGCFNVDLNGFLFILFINPRFNLRFTRPS
jgi:hypothetical protein